MGAAADPLRAGVWRSPPPSFARRGGNVTLRRDLVRGAKMHFGYIAQGFRTLCVHKLFGGLFHARRYAAAQSHAELFALSLQPVDERLSRDDRRRRNRNVRFGSRSLLD